MAAFLFLGFTFDVALAQERDDIQLERFGAEQPNSTIYVEDERMRFNPTLTPQQLSEVLTESERERLHPDFQDLLAQERLGEPVAPAQRIEEAPGIRTRADGQVTYNTIVYTQNPGSIEAAGLHVNSRFENFVTVQATVADLSTMAGNESVRFMEPGELAYPTTNMSVAETGASLLHDGFIRDMPIKGDGAIVCVYDSGIQFDHEDFIDENGESRIRSLWDQTLNPQGGESSPDGFNFGVEYSRSDITNAIQGNGSGVRQDDQSGHGTHVAGIAAGNGRAQNGMYTGMAPEADIVVVKGGDSSFPISNTIDALSYCDQVGDEEDKPVVLNLSIGSQFGAHDGTRPHEEAIDAFSENPGRAVVTSAGNDGNDEIHRGFTLPGDSEETVEFYVPDYSPSSGSNNDFFRFDSYYDGNPDVTVTVTSPPIYDTTGDGSPDSSVVVTREPGETGTADNDDAGRINIYHSDASSSGGDDLRTNLQVFDGDADKPPVSGMWQLTLTNNSGQSVDYHGWLYRVSSSLSDMELVNGDTDYTISSPGNAFKAITVGAYDIRRVWPVPDGRTFGFSQDLITFDQRSNFSSLGPTRDGRIKPEISAPGRAIAAAKPDHVTFDGGDGSTRVLRGGNHMIRNGTSMASPHGAGAAALVLAQDPSMQIDQLRELLQETARQDEFTGSTVNTEYGAGKLDAFQAVAEVLGSQAGPRTKYVYANERDRRVTPSSHELALRFTPEESGLLTSFQLDIGFQGSSSAVRGDGDLLYALYADDGGFPGERLTGWLRTSLNDISPSAVNRFGMLNAIRSNLEVQAGMDYHVVLRNENQGDLVEIYAEERSTADRSTARERDGGSWVRARSAFNQAMEYRIMPMVTPSDEVADPPIQLASFDASLEGENAVLLTWRTSREEGSDRFEVQHAPPESEFEQVAVVNAAGDSEEPVDYEYLVEDVEEIGTHHFRLVVVDTEGRRSQTSEVTVMLQVEGTHTLASPYPNPFTDYVNFDIAVSEEQEVRAEAYDVLGRRVQLIFEETIPADQQRQFRFSAGNLSSGVYLVRITGETFAETERVVLVR